MYVLILHGIDLLIVVIPGDSGIWGLDAQKGETGRHYGEILRLAENDWFSGTTCW